MGYVVLLVVLVNVLYVVWGYKRYSMLNKED